MTAAETEARIRHLRAERDRLPRWPAARRKKGRELQRVIPGVATASEQR
jgi:hypothetical protein